MRKIMDQLDQIIENEDLTKMVNMIESQINNGDYTAMDLAAAFLYQALGKAEREGVKQDIFDFSDTGAEDGMVRLFINIGKNSACVREISLEQLPESPECRVIW